MTTKMKQLSSLLGTISPCGYAGMNGSYFNNIFIEKRNVVIRFER